VEELKGVLESLNSVEGKSVDQKDKKIIELAKKNRDLTIRVENLKNKAAKATQDALKL
jgi:hypothetical protein